MTMRPLSLSSHGAFPGTFPDRCRDDTAGITRVFVTFSPGLPTRRANSRQLPCGTMRFVEFVVLTGGVGGAKFLRGVRAAAPEADITAIVNTGDDVTLHGLRICPDLDSVVYTLAGVHDAERGWGRAEESWRVMGELASYGAEPSWFGLGDLDIATHLVRTRMLDAGFALSDVTEALCARWEIGARILPMSDQRCETHVIVDDPDSAVADGGSRRKAIHFQEWWIKHRAAL